MSRPYHASAKVFRSFVHLAYRINLLLFVVLAGWQSTQDAYLAQATDHAMAKDLARHLGQPDYEQVLETGQRRWLCHREEGTGSRDLTPYSPDLWLTFDQEGAYATGRNSVIRPSWNNRSDSNLAGLPIERRYAMAQPRERASATGLHMTGLMILRMGRSPLPMVSEVWVQASTIQLEPSVGWRMAPLPLPRPHVEEPLRRGGSDEWKRGIHFSR